MRSLWWLALGGLSGCLPVQQTVSVVDTPLSSRQQTERGAPELAAEVASDAAGVSLDLQSKTACRERTVQTIRRVEHHRREGIGALVGLEYVVGAASLGGGGFIAYDAHADVRTVDVGTPEQGARIGYTVAGLGVALVTLAIVESVRMRDRIVVRAPFESVDRDSAREVACEHGPAGATVVQLAIGATPVVIGTTDATGHLRATWDVLPEHALDGDHAPTKATVVVQTATATKPVGMINLAPARTAIAERAWQDAKAAATRSAVIAFRKRFGDVHPGEATSLAATLFARDIEAALAAGQTGDARHMLEEWEALDRGSPAQTQLRQRLDELQRANDLTLRWQTYTTRVGAARQEATAGELAVLATELDALLAIEPEHAPGAVALRDELSAIRRDTVKRLVADADTLRRDGQPDIALKLVAQAATIDPAAREPSRERTKIRGEIVAKGSAQVRTLIRAKDHDGARRILAGLEALVPDDPQLARLRTELDKAQAREAARQKRGSK